MSPSSCRTALILIGLAVLASGCSTPTPYIVVPESTPEPGPMAPEPRAGGAYTVKAGDSLYLISFATGTDWREIASLNGIQPPYTIYPGQQLRLPGLAGGATPVASPEPAEAMARTTPVAPKPIVRPAPAPAVAESRPVSGAPVAPTPPLQGRPEPSPGAPVASAAVAAPAVASKTEQVAAATPPKKAAVSGPPPKPGAWQWPTRGALLSRFAAGAQPHKGIDLAGRMGEPVHAANSGTVVYAGSGVRGYGNLLILKHDAVFLSAYAHNSKLLVQEGEPVRAGQQIAELGDSGTDRVKLHFEIRRNGSPVDPLKILPRR